MNQELTWMPAWRIAELVAAGDASPVEVAEHFLDRIEEFQPTLQALTNVNPQLVHAQAKAAGAAVRAGDPLGSLHGVPVAVKHHIDIAGMPRAGAPLWFGTARRDDLTVERLRDSGAIVMGHTTMPVMTMEGEYRWEFLAKNPWDPERVAGASSAGSASAAAAALLPLTLGSDGAGSSRLPPAYTGVVGMHPTAGMVPWVDHRRWAIRLGTTIGPIARDARDVAIALQVIAGPDGRDHMGLPLDLPDPRAELDGGAAGLRLAWSHDLGFASEYWVPEGPRVVRRIREAAFALRGIGAEVQETGERWADHIAAMNVHRSVFTDMPVLGPEAGAAVSERDWEAATDLRQRNWLRFRKLFAEYDLLLCPTQHSVAPPIDTWSAWWSEPASKADGVAGVDGHTVYTSMFNWLRFPAASVGCGFVDGLPVGLQIVGPPGSDPTILRLAHAFQQAFPQQDRPQVS